MEPARKKAEAAGVKSIFIEDVREEFVRDYVFPMFRYEPLPSSVLKRGVASVTLALDQPCHWIKLCFGEGGVLGAAYQF